MEKRFLKSTFGTSYFGKVRSVSNMAFLLHYDVLELSQWEWQCVPTGNSLQMGYGQIIILHWAASFPISFCFT
ncbi:hypothetical protein MtrunA17_Chr7g0238061 [Medicago truncatula]|uniref:Uncharacterized protein n=1 Tax=Medicago truncatula TaxID=3880 RepID=A0A396H0Q4_MEDTR|nr:hypothetical protein MtrunA17_Chr7g0238061 [Medicago truncatula]